MITGEEIVAALPLATDLEGVQKAVSREVAIRGVMAETGESREVVTKMSDALASMDQEAVLELTEGEPGSLASALRRYVNELWKTSGDEVSVIAGDLTALLAYPWPLEEASQVAQRIHRIYLKHAAKRSFELAAWEELDQEERDLATTVIRELLEFPRDYQA